MKQAFCAPAHTNMADGCRKLIALQTLEKGLHSGLGGAEGGLRAEALMGRYLIIRH